MTRASLTACLAAVLALPAPRPQAQPARGPRAELERLAAALDAAVRQVSLPSVEPLLGNDPARGYYVGGLGAVFVVPPRSVPRQRRVRLLRPGQPPAPDALDYAELEELLGAEGARRFAEQQRRQDAARREAASLQPSEQELRALEERAAAFQREAEASRREFELLVAQMMRHAQGRPVATRPRSTAAVDTPAGAEAPAPATAETGAVPGATLPGTPADEAALGTPGPPPRAAGGLLPPWHMWSGLNDAADTRSAERIVSDVREALMATLEAQGGELRSLPPDELISVAVDFVPRGLFGTAPRPTHTLVVRVRKRALDERAAGRLTREAFQRQVQVSEY